MINFDLSAAISLRHASKNSNDTAMIKNGMNHTDNDRPFDLINGILPLYSRPFYTLLLEKFNRINHPSYRLIPLMVMSLQFSAGVFNDERFCE